MKILEKNFSENSSFHFIQVGANDGINHDDLYYFIKSRDSAGVAIEPLKDFYQKLVTNYTFTNNIKFINKAVHSYQKRIALYRIHPKYEKLFPKWAQGIASLDYKHHKKSGVPSELIVKEEVCAEHLMKIVKESYSFNVIDLIQIDVEGYDFEVLKMIDFKIMKPKIVKFEFINLQHHEFIAARKLLKRQGYFCFNQYPDLIAVNLFLIKL